MYVRDQSNTASAVSGTWKNMGAFGGGSGLYWYGPGCSGPYNTGLFIRVA